MYLTDSQLYLTEQPGIGGSTRNAGSHHDEGRRLRAFAHNLAVRLRFREHALREMAKDGISQLDIKSMLKRCSVATDRDETRITAVVVIDEDEITIKVITAWRHQW
ncbi:MAG: DUF4258 domain-containing protein [Acetobacteraceae bacterium]|nr:DUF4258 domain-containing protein [Acetobacteraceae bacterium]